MTTKSTKALRDLQERFQKLGKFKSDEDELKHDAQMLMYRFLNETQRHQDIQGVNRKSLAQKVKTSASYLTQLFRGDKALNFLTLAKFQKSLNITFKIEAISNTSVVDIEDEGLWLKSIEKYHVQGGYWCYKNIPIHKDVYNAGIEEELLMDNAIDYDYQEIPA